MRKSFFRFSDLSGAILSKVLYLWCPFLLFFPKNLEGKRFVLIFAASLPRKWMQKRGRRWAFQRPTDAAVEQKPGGWDTHNVKGVYSALCSFTAWIVDFCVIPFLTNGQHWSLEQWNDATESGSHAFLYVYTN